MRGADQPSTSAVPAILLQLRQLHTCAGMKGIVEEQHLFNLYVHLPPNKTLEGPPTIFNGHEIPGSIQTGEHCFVMRSPVWPCILPKSTLFLR